MQLRAPAYPLITVDPYFSVWSPSDRLTDTNTVFWCNTPKRINGICNIDGKDYRFIGAINPDITAMRQVSVDVSSFSTTYVFEQDGVRVTAVFTSPNMPDDFYYISRPVSYLELKKAYTDGHRHTVSFDISFAEDICMDKQGDGEAICEKLTINGLNSVKVGLKEQKVLGRSGDQIGPDWGYFYLTGSGATYIKKDESGCAWVGIKDEFKTKNLLTFAYDDVDTLEYFHEKVQAYWKQDGKTITDVIAEAHKDYNAVLKKCCEFDLRQFAEATKAGGEKYAELLQLATRQVTASHKLCIDKEGNILFISKECNSNGCAATVDVSYPSIPVYLIYNPELVRGMMRPIYKYVNSGEWEYDFAPHDAGQYPLLNGQVYGGNALNMQMPVEECGNMLIMETAVAVATKDVSFAAEHMDILDTWVKYLIDNGRDPENQLCTDDFAGHLAHNCNLTLKAIMGVAGYGILKGMLGNKAEKRKYLAMAKDMCLDWAKRASNGDGSYRLAFDAPGTFSLKYNIVWDKVFGLDMMPKEVIQSEINSLFSKMNPYGIDLDNRKKYTKSDWIIWTATLASTRADFERFVNPMWEMYNRTDSRVPMTDWYWTVTGNYQVFRNRTVIGGLFMKLLDYKGIMKL